VTGYSVSKELSIFQIYVLFNIYNLWDCIFGKMKSMLILIVPLQELHWPSIEVRASEVAKNATGQHIFTIVAANLNGGAGSESLYQTYS
jgi:hypothetical protein